ncbi:MAG: thermonuclease family protein, partial [Candidatus Woesebacteria bacterium]|nr:thermonuclease family protein [Candidatus Woesebacteria bacterium]
GDTIEIEGGKTVRFIGIDTSETVHPTKPVQCYGKEASAKTKELLEGQEIRLEKDISEVDRYNRLLRYIWKGDILINEFLVKEGFAQVSTYPPDVKYQERFLAAQKDARDNNRGLWSVCPPQTSNPSVQPASTPIVKATVKPTITIPSGSSGSSYTCNCSKTCPNMSCAEAQYQLKTCGCTARDTDHDGIACDSQCQ